MPIALCCGKLPGNNEICDDKVPAVRFCTAGTLSACQDHVTDKDFMQISVYNTKIWIKALFFPSSENGNMLTV